MLKYKIILVCLLLPLVAIAKPVIAEPIETINPVFLSPEGQVDYFTKLYGSDPEIVKKVIRCESQWNNNARGDNGNANGIGQFWESTFYRMAKILGEELNYKSEFDQIKLLSFAMSKPELAREWTSYRAIMNGGTYSFYSKALKKHYTVTCR
jgi:hypothetical protein